MSSVKSTMQLVPQDMRGAAAELGRLSGDTDEARQQLRSSWNRLDGGWEWYAAEDINGYYGRAMDVMGRMAAVLREMDEALVKTADLIEAADLAAAGLFEKIGEGKDIPAPAQPGEPVVSLPYSVPEGLPFAAPMEYTSTSNRTPGIPSDLYAPTVLPSSAFVGPIRPVEPSSIMGRKAADLWDSPNGLLNGLIVGGRYNMGQVYALGEQWPVYVPPKQTGYVRDMPNIAFHYNADMAYPAKEGWQTQAVVQGFATLPSLLLVDIGVGLAASSQSPQGWKYSPGGLPVTRDIYKSIVISESGLAYIGEKPDKVFFDASDPATLEYRPVVDVRETTGKYDASRRFVITTPDKYAVEGAIPGPIAMRTVAVVNGLSVVTGILGQGNINDRAYQVVLQKNQDGEKRAVVQTFYVFQNNDYQISPRYLSVDENGQLQEETMIYPYTGPVINDTSQCGRISTCYNDAKFFKIEQVTPIPGVNYEKLLSPRLQPQEDNDLRRRLELGTKGEKP